MCVQSVSLWAEATWYRLTGAGAPDVADAPREAPEVEALEVEASPTSDELRPNGQELVGQGSR